MVAHKVIIAGFGGQGIMLLGQMIAYAGMLENKEVTWMPSYGPEMRGGTANCSVIVSDKKISSPVITEATAVAVMNLPSLVKFEQTVKTGGKLFINSSLIKERASRDDIEACYVNANEIAINKSGNEKVSNMVMLGAVINRTNIVTLESIDKVMEKLFAGKKSELLPLNKEALRAWKVI